MRLKGALRWWFLCVITMSILYVTWEAGRRTASLGHQRVVGREDNQSSTPRVTRPSVHNSAAEPHISPGSAPSTTGPSTDHPMQDGLETRRWQEKQDKLKRHVAKMCLISNQSTHPLGHLIIVDDRHKVLYCIVSKVASTTWRNVLLPQGNLSGMPVLKFLNSSEISWRLDTYFKFMFVRNPFERLLSAYRFRFEEDCSVCAKYMPEDPRPGSVESYIGTNMTFEEFGRFVVGGHPHPHWTSYEDLCNPCDIHYDIIGKVETFDEDAKYVLRRVFNRTDPGVTDLVHAKNVNKKAPAATILPSYLNQLPKSLMKDLCKYFSSDGAMFDYELPCEYL